MRSNPYRQQKERLKKMDCFVARAPRNDVTGEKANTDAETKRTQQCVRVQHDGVRFVVRAERKSFASKIKIFHVQKQNVLRPRRKCSAPNRKMFHAQQKNVLRPRGKCSTSKIKIEWNK